MSNSIFLKWGTVKGWDFDDTTSEAFRLLKAYMEGSPASCMADHPGEERKNLLCKVIDKIDGEIRNDWTGEIMTKQEAKKYVMDYRSTT